MSSVTEQEPLNPAAAENSRGLRSYILWLAIAAASILIRLPDFYLPMNRDSGMFAYGGWRMLSGGLPYVTFWDNKLPGVFFINAFAIKIFGASQAGLIVFQMGYAALTGWVFYIIARRFCREKPALITTILFLTYQGSFGLAEDGNYTESYMALPVLLAALILLNWSRERKNLMLLFLAGMLTAIAGVIKQPAAAIIPAMLLFVLVSERRKGIAPALTILAGAGIIGGSLVTWMACKGILHDAMDANLVFNRLYFIDSYTDGLPVALWNIPRGLVMTALPLTGAIAAIAAGRLKNASVPRIAWLLVPWLIFDLFGIAMGGRFSNHYFLQILPSAFILTAIFIDGALRSQKAVFALITAGLVLSIGPVWSIKDTTLDHVKNPISSIIEREYHILDVIFTERLSGGAQLPAEQFSQWLKQRTDPSDTIYIWGWDTRAAFMIQRRIPSRYVHLHPLGATGFDRDTRIREVARDLKIHRPKYIVDENPIMPTTAPPLGPVKPLKSTMPFFRLDGYEPVKEVVARYYQPITVVGNCTIYERK